MTASTQPFGPERGGAIGVTPKLFRPLGALYETVPRQWGPTIATSPTITSGTLFLTGIELPSDQALNGIAFMTDATTALVSGTHQIFGLFDDQVGSSSGTPYKLLAGTSDDTNVAWPISTVKRLNFSAPYSTTRGGAFYLGLLVTAGTPPGLVAVGFSVAVATLPPIQAGDSSTGLTALPDPAIAPTPGQKLAYAWVF
jgi:hypothetical protein